LKILTKLNLSVLLPLLANFALCFENVRFRTASQECSARGSQPAHYSSSKPSGLRRRHYGAMSALSLKQSSLEIENLHLREALSFAKRGWEDALALLKNTPNATSSYLREGENVLEISSLQMELDSLHKNMFHRAQQASAFKTRLMQVTNHLAAQVDDLAEMIKCPPTEGLGADAGGSGSMVEELSYAEGDADIDEQLLFYCAKVEAHALRVASLSAFIKRSSEPYDNGEAEAETGAGAGTGTGAGVTGSKSKAANGGGVGAKKSSVAATATASATTKKKKSAK
jgi:hypothetical protein